eukprot:NODE_9514_length_638_cov_116.052427_g9248_i0.p2 GENE.NODE_9514_length_638_cov_116.052427_g9248_i0~~NODE_9514_length_638_cov_116.052427_g9248_i0.p2  ORF type:complete len:108 (-),score=7.52 NODE_9514_length_638_cov_116.052427_g9248_i0:175-498(-)
MVVEVSETVPVGVVVDLAARVLLDVHVGVAVGVTLKVNVVVGECHASLPVFNDVTVDVVVGVEVELRVQDGVIGEGTYEGLLVSVRLLAARLSVNVGVGDDEGDEDG